MFGQKEADGRQSKEQIFTYHFAAINGVQY
jgi:hypothetical protein